MKRVLIIFLIWASSGVYFLYRDWTSEFDLTVKDAIVIGVMGVIVGPFAVITLIIDTGTLSDVVLIKKR